MICNYTDVVQQSQPVKAGPFQPPTKDYAYHADVGWIEDIPGYWFAIFEGQELVTGVGLDGALPQLADLLEKSWGYIEWETPEAQLILQQLSESILSERRPQVRELLRYRAMV